MPYGGVLPAQFVEEMPHQLLRTVRSCNDVNLCAWYAKLRALEKKANKVEKMKIKKDGSRMWTEVGELGQRVREGKVPPRRRHTRPHHRPWCPCHAVGGLTLPTNAAAHGHPASETSYFV